MWYKAEMENDTSESTTRFLARNLLESCFGQYEPIAKHARYALFRILVEISSDLLVEHLVSFVDIGDWLVAVVLGLSLLFAETGIVS
jgi:hypothetical protein